MSIHNPLEPLRTSALTDMKNALRPGPPWDSICDFATHRSFCNKRLYPRQLTLLKLIYLETDNMTDYDLEVINGWAEGFKAHKDIMGVPPDVWDRVTWLKENGYDHFTQVQAVGGRRGSKGIIGGILGAERLAYFYSLGDWQAHFGLDPGSVGELTVVSTSQATSAKRQFADIRRTVEGCRYLRSHIIGNRYTEFSIRTPADEVRINALKLAGVPVDREIASLYINASASSSATMRGGAVFAAFYDEFAHFLMGSGSVKSGEEIYEGLQPSLDQFGRQQITFIPSSPYCLEPSTRVLTEDLFWVSVGSLKIGDKLIGFDEEASPGKGGYRAWRPAEVTETSVIQAPRYELTMESGKKIVCTGEHMWLAKAAPGIGQGNGRGLGRPPGISQRYVWAKTKDLQVGDAIKTIDADPWETDESRGGGYLAGFFDGEGHLAVTGRQAGLGYTQNRGPVLDKVNALLAERGYGIRDNTPDSNLSKSYLLGGFPMMMRFLGSIRPERLLPKLVGRLYGSRVYGRGGEAVDRVVSMEFKDHGPVVALGTSTNTLVAEGLLSHNTKIGKFYELYQQGVVTMDEYDQREGRLSRQTMVGEMMGVPTDDDLDVAMAEPEWLVCQFPSWELYTDWERSQEIPVRKGSTRMGFRFRNPVQWPPIGDRPENTRMRRLERRNPDKFKVERRAQFASVIDAYLDEARVDAMFEVPLWRKPLTDQDHGLLMYTYRMHGDPSTTNANFGFCIAHLEDSPCDGCGWTPTPEDPTHTICQMGGHIWPHVIIDKLKVWKPENFPGHTIDYVAVGEQIEGYCQRFISTRTVSFDQWNSAGFLSNLKRKFGGRMRIIEQTFTEKENTKRAELFKSILNLGWIHSYRDNFFDEGQGSLLEVELKFLQEKLGKVVKQEFGPCTTKDLADAVMVVSVDLLHQALDRWHTTNRVAVGSTAVAPLRSGRETDRQRLYGMNNHDPSGRGVGTNRARLMDQQRERTRNNRIPNFNIRQRGRP